MSFENLNLSKQLVNGMNTLGFTEPTPIQSKTITKILGGQELVIVAHEKSGKTTACLLAILKKLLRPDGYDARAVMLVPTKEAVLEVEELLTVLNKTQLRCMGLYSGGGMSDQSDDLFEGVDLIISTPERLAELHLRKGILLRKVKMLVIDGTERMLEQGLLSSVHRILEALPQKYQRVLTTEIYDHRVEKLINNYFEIPNFVELEFEESKLVTIESGLFQVPNYRTKQNLLTLLLMNEEWYTKTIVFVNTQVTCQNLYKSLDRRYEGEIATLDARYMGHVSYDSVTEFKESSSRVLLIVRDEETLYDVSGVPEVFNFDIPTVHDMYVDLVDSESYEEGQTPPIITSFATPTELLSVAKIEVLLGEKVECWDLPVALVIEGTRQRTFQVEKEDEIKGGGAFHEKKWKNRKEHNYTYHNPKPSDKKNRKK